MCPWKGCELGGSNYSPWEAKAFSADWAKKIPSLSSVGGGSSRREHAQHYGMEAAWHAAFIPVDYPAVL